MKVLFISNDPALFDPTSAVSARMRFYAEHFEELHIVSPGPLGAREREENNLFSYPVIGWRLFRIGALARRARTLILARGIDVVSTQDPFELGVAGLRAVRSTRA